MSIFLTILSVIGKILLILLLVLLALIIYLLFSPLFYRADGSFSEKTRLSAGIHDALRLFSADVSYEDGLAVKLRFLFGLIRIDPTVKKEKKGYRKAGGGKTAADEEKKKGKTEKTEQAEGTEQIEKPAQTEKAEQAGKTEKTEKTKKAVRSEAAGRAADASSDASPADGKEKKKKKSSGMGKIILENRKGLQKIIMYALRLLKKLLPTIRYADLDFSAGSPDVTGYATGVLAALPFVYGEKKSFRPDFTADDPYVRGSIGLGGKVFPFYVVYIIIRIFIDQDSGRLLRQLLAAKKQSRKTASDQEEK